MIIHTSHKDSAKTPPDSPVTRKSSVLCNPPNYVPPPPSGESPSKNTVIDPPQFDINESNKDLPANSKDPKNDLSKSGKRKYNIPIGNIGNIGNLSNTIGNTIGNIGIGNIAIPNIAIPNIALKYKNNNSPPRTGSDTPRREEIVRENLIGSGLKMLFDSLKSIIDKHIEMKPILFEKVTEFKRNPDLKDFLNRFRVLIETYDMYCSIWEEKRPTLREVLVKNKKERFMELNTLSQQFEEIHMIPIESFLNEISLRAVHIYTMLAELKEITQPEDSEHALLTELCTYLEPIYDKIVARKKNEIQNSKEEKKSKRASRSINDKTKVSILSPRTDKKIL